MVYLNLFDLFVNNVFGNPYFAIFGVLILMIIAGLFTNWGTELIFIFSATYLFTMLTILNPVYGMLIFAVAFTNFGYAIYVFLRRDGG